MEQKQVNILLVEDDDVEREAVRRGFRAAKVANPVHSASDGLEALDMLRGTGGKKQIERPYIILLDLNMPRMNGLEFLDEVRADPELKDSVIFVLTTSEVESDRVAAYDKNVAGFVLKSRLDEDFANLVTMLDHYWRFVELPIAR